MVTVVDFIKAPMMNNTANLGSTTGIDYNSADTAKSAAGKEKCANLFDSLFLSFIKVVVHV